MAGGIVHIKWYATGFRGDDLEAALSQLAPLSLRHGAVRYDVHRNRDDRYMFLMATEWEDKSDWDAFWFGEDFTDMRAACSGWYQIPLLYVWNDKVSSGEIQYETNGNGEAAPAAVTAAEGPSAGRRK